MAEGERKSVDVTNQDVSVREKGKNGTEENKETADESNKEEVLSNFFDQSIRGDGHALDLGMPEVAESIEGDEAKSQSIKEADEDGETEDKKNDTKPVDEEDVEKTTQSIDKLQETIQESVGEDDAKAPEGPITEEGVVEDNADPRGTMVTEHDADNLSIITNITNTDTVGPTSPKKKKKGTRRTIYYDFKPRFREDEIDMRKPSGDFGLLEEDADAPTKFYGYMDDDQKEEEEEIEEEVEEEEIIRIDREPYYQKHIALNEQISTEKVKNNILQKKLAMFFKRRKMEHVLKEADQQYDTQVKYGKKLDFYEELIGVDKVQRETITKELDVLKIKRDNKYDELTKLFEEMLARETETGTGLIYTKTGNTIPEKLVERLVHRQSLQMEEVCRMRLQFIQLKDMVAEKQDAIASLDIIGDGLHLMDFEQLKVENRSYADKIEERDEELTRLRFKCQNTIQILAHIREKSSALESDIDDLKDDTAMVDRNFLEAREQINGVKQERDNYRLQIYKLRSDSGLLTEPALLRDMEASMEELKLTTDELEELKEENKIKAQQIRNIRRNIEFGAEGLMKKSYRNLSTKPKMPSQTYKGRPSLFLPTLPGGAFDYLKDFQPKVRMIKTKK